MKRHFSVDENTVILAHTRTTDRGGPDDTCLQLIFEIVRNCHAFVWTPEVWGKYSHQVRMLERRRQKIVPGVMRLIKSSLIDPKKNTMHLQDDQLTEVVELDDMRNVNPGDRVFVRCAASVQGSILVATDRPLLDDLRKASIPERYGFVAVLPTDARSLTGPDGT